MSICQSGTDIKIADSHVISANAVSVYTLQFSSTLIHLIKYINFTDAHIRFF
jgi:hypothetical protein